MTARDDLRIEAFEFEADAWDFLYDSGFVARLNNHREFDHPDGRWAVVIPSDDNDPETEVKIYGKSGHGACDAFVVQRPLP